MKQLIIAGIIALTILPSCVDNSVWADDGPSRHDIIQKELKENYLVATEDNDLYGVMIILTENDSIVLQCRDDHDYRTGLTEDIDIVVDVNQVWIYKDIFYPDGNVRRFRLEWLYHNTHSSEVMYYIHEPGLEHLNELLDTRSIAIYSSIWDRLKDGVVVNQPRDIDYHGLWKEVDYENMSHTYQ